MGLYTILSLSVVFAASFTSAYTVDRNCMRKDERSIQVAMSEVLRVAKYSSLRVKMNDTSDHRYGQVVDELLGGEGEGPERFQTRMDAIHDAIGQYNGRYTPYHPEADTSFVIRCGESGIAKDPEMGGYRFSEFPAMPTFSTAHASEPPCKWSVDIGAPLTAYSIATGFTSLQGPPFAIVLCDNYPGESALTLTSSIGKWARARWTSPLRVLNKYMSVSLMHELLRLSESSMSLQPDRLSDLPGFGDVPCPGKSEELDTAKSYTWAAFALWLKPMSRKNVARLQWPRPEGPSDE